MSRKPIPHKELLKDPEYAAIYVEELEEQYQFLLRHLSQAQAEIQAMERVVEAVRRIASPLDMNLYDFPIECQYKVKLAREALAELDKVKEGKK